MPALRTTLARSVSEPLLPEQEAALGGEGAGGAAAVTVMVADCVALPPDPVQVIE